MVIAIVICLVKGVNPPRHFRHFFRQNRHKSRHFHCPLKIKGCVSQAADIILEVIDIQEENFD